MCSPARHSVRTLHLRSKAGSSSTATGTRSTHKRYRAVSPCKRERTTRVLVGSAVRLLVAIVFVPSHKAAASRLFRQRIAAGDPTFTSPDNRGTAAVHADFAVKAGDMVSHRILRE